MPEKQKKILTLLFDNRANKNEAINILGFQSLQISWSIWSNFPNINM